MPRIATRIPAEQATGAGARRQLYEGASEPKEVLTSSTVDWPNATWCEGDR
jgi:hypothetical protein